ncbi:hypothetical protein VIGAN_03047900 [Vigna angularis var. angularis]|uniref:Vesicle transport protein n=1 Tax=Vigna angularis var. angularis TaxID=157739 RepID=A0A0S3RJU6_PHAAN|nr:hypothetical protein VIGAN_03047900 [Vigna angularis var. angularis]
MVSFEMNDRKKIGLGLTGFGIFFSFIGIIFFFDKGLLAMGNILFVSGVSLTIGLKSTMQFFMKRSNFKGTISFGVGFFILIIGWPILGMIIELYGFIILFRFSANLKEFYYVFLYFTCLKLIMNCTAQWILAYTGRFLTEDSCSWLVG